MSEENSFPFNVSMEESIELRENINDHMRLVANFALMAIEQLTKSQDDFDKSLSDLLHEKIHPTDFSSLSIVPKKRIDAFQPVNPDNINWKTDFDRFMATSEDQLLEDTGSVQYFMFAGVRYYLEKLKDEKFFLLSDLPEMLAVDRRITIMISYCYAKAIQKPNLSKEIRRLHNASSKRSAIKNTSWKQVQAALNKIKADQAASRKKDEDEKQWTIGGISNYLYKNFDFPTAATIDKWFTERLGKEIKGKKYSLSDLITMANSQ